jgi:hypothetical protein
MSGELKKIKGSKWNPRKFHTGTKVLVVAKRRDLDIDEGGQMGEVVHIGCNTIPVALIRLAGGTIDKKRVSVPAVLRENKRLVIVGGEVFGHTGWYEDNINDYAHRIIIISAPEQEPEKEERYVTPGLWQCTNELHRHSWFITGNGMWLGLMQGYVDTAEQPGHDCHPALIANLNRVTGSKDPITPVKVEVYKSATCCMTDMSSSLPKDHPDYKAPRTQRRGLFEFSIPVA